MPNQLISALINFRIDLFNQIYDLIKVLHENVKDDIDIVRNIYYLCSKIKLIFIKTILKSILLENHDNLDYFFHLHQIYNFNNLYNLFSDQDFFREFLIDNILKVKLNYNRLENIPIILLNNLKINSFVLFKMNLTVEIFSNKIEKLRYNIDNYFSNEKLDLNKKNLMLKDFYFINYSLEQMTIKIIFLIILVLKRITEIFSAYENSNLSNIDSPNESQGM
jgi:hypothetical protein